MSTTRVNGAPPKIVAFTRCSSSEWQASIPATTRPLSRSVVGEQVRRGGGASHSSVAYDVARSVARVSWTVPIPSHMSLSHAATASVLPLLTVRWSESGGD